MSALFNITNSTITMRGEVNSEGVPVSLFRNQATTGELVDLRNSNLNLQYLNITSIRDFIGFVDTVNVNNATVKDCIFIFDGIGCLVTLRVGGYVYCESLNNSHIKD
jgi:hypothetical protein